MTKLTRRALLASAGASGLAASMPALPAAAATPGPVLIRGAAIFNGTSPDLVAGADVLIENGLISGIGEGLSADGAQVIDADGRTLMPGLIDAHWHTSYCCAPQSTVVRGDILEVAIRGAMGSTDTLMRGFTTVRDVGGNPFSTKRMIDAGEVLGPRIYPSGPPISQTAGHFDYRPLQVVPSNAADPLDYWNRVGLLLVADGVAEVTKRTREVLRMGATQIKISGGGGVSSVFDPLDVRQYTFDELRAFVEVADTWNTYVAAHIFTDDATQLALKAGVMSIEHGMLMSDETLLMMKEKGAWLSMQPLLDDEDAFKFNDPFSTAKWEQVTQGTDRIYPLAKEIGVKIAFGTDMLFDPATAAKQGKFLAKLKRWFSPFEALKMATHDNAELIGMCGPRDPYPQGKLGIVAEGAHADLLLVNGNPLEDLDLVADPDANFAMIMKAGVAAKNRLE